MLATLGTWTPVVGGEPELFQARSCSKQRCFFSLSMPAFDNNVLFSPSEFSRWKSRYFRTMKNVGSRSLGSCAKPF